MDPALISADGTSDYEIVLVIDPAKFDVAQGKSAVTCSKSKKTNFIWYSLKFYQGKDRVRLRFIENTPGYGWNDSLCNQDGDQIGNKINQPPVW